MDKKIIYSVTIETGKTYTTRNKFKITRLVESNNEYDAALEMRDMLSSELNIHFDGGAGYTICGIKKV